MPISLATNINDVFKTWYIATNNFIIIVSVNTKIGLTQNYK